MDQRFHQTWAGVAALGILGAACRPTQADVGRSDDTSTSSTGPGSGSEGGSTTTGPGSTTEANTTQTRFDLPSTMVDIPPPATQSCTVTENSLDGSVCNTKAPPDSFQAEVQWTWFDAEAPHSWVNPLVANLTDDNGDGKINLCDTPDVVVISFLALSDTSGPIGATLTVLDGATGDVHFQLPEINIHNACEPALGDIDNDGLPEIVTCTKGGPPGTSLIVLEHDGSEKWVSDVLTGYNPGLAVALADADQDGDVEIGWGNHILDHEGNILFSPSNLLAPHAASAFADLDDDGNQEFILGNIAYQQNGSTYYTTELPPGFPQIADFDGDQRPEVLVTTSHGINYLEHDGTVAYDSLRPTGDPPGGLTWVRPATIHDFDGDGTPEYALSSQNHYTAYHWDGKIMWSALINDFTGIAGGTAFDFLGDGTAEAMYADEHSLFAFDDEGLSLVEVPRRSLTIIEYPIVADIDNDGSAEILVVSNFSDEDDPQPTVTAIRDADDRWIQARRIWNQHTYHVTNVREDGTIPQFEEPHWKLLNSYRTNAQIEQGAVCIPQ